MTKKTELFKNIALMFAEESHCESKKVCCLAIKDNRIIASGINGTPSGNINCDDYWKKQYFKRKIKVPYDEWIQTPEWREEHHKWSTLEEVHAEQNLVAFAASNGISLKDCDIYVTLEPCITCMKLLLSIKPKNIFYFKKYDKNADFSVEQFFKKNNINCELI